jgi:HSP20 family protein
MDPFSKKLMRELEEMERAGRMMRNMSLARRMPYLSGNWQPPVDVYEAEDVFYLYVDLAGINREALDVLADEHQVRIKGTRTLPPESSIACVHQLEIEMGPFERTVALPATVDVNGVSSVYTDGILVITLPKRKERGKVQIRISPGE